MKGKRGGRRWGSPKKMKKLQRDIKERAFSEVGLCRRRQDTEGSKEREREKG